MKYGQTSNATSEYWRSIHQIGAWAGALTTHNGHSSTRVIQFLPCCTLQQYSSSTLGIATMSSFRFSFTNQKCRKWLRSSLVITASRSGFSGCHSGGGTGLASCPVVEPSIGFPSCDTKGMVALASRNSNCRSSASSLEGGIERGDSKTPPLQTPSRSN